MKKLGVGIIGCGNVAGGHIRGWLQHADRARVVALCDLMPEFCQEKSKELDLGDVPVHWQGKTGLVAAEAKEAGFEGLIGLQAAQFEGERLS